MSRKHSITPQAISYYEEDEFTKSKNVRGPINYEVFEKRYRSNEWPSVNHKTPIWNGTEFKQWTPIYAIDDLFKKLDPKKYNQLKQKKKDQQQQQPQQEQEEINETQQNHRKKHQKTMKAEKINDRNNNNNNKYNVYNKYNKYGEYKSKYNICKWSRASYELLKWLLISRTIIFLFGIGMIYFLNISPFDSSSEMLNVYIFSKLNQNESWIDYIDGLSLKYLTIFSNWDGQYFLHIAQYGYEHEKIYAFYPGLPLIINSIILFMTKIINGLHFKSMALICGIIWNGFISSYLSSLILYYLTVKIYNKPSIALIASKLFLINPASIFFCSIYTESTFSFVSFLLMLCCELKYFDYNKYINIHSIILTISIILCIIIASSLRSNGIIIIGFPLYYHIYSNWFFSNNIINALSFIRYKMQNIFCYSIINKKEKEKEKEKENLKHHKNGYHKNNNMNSSEFMDHNELTQKMSDNHWNWPCIFISILKLFGLIFLLFIGLTPWFYYHHWSKISLCSSSSSSSSLSQHRLYCHSIISTVYSYVQYKYWHCGFLLRWNLNEIGNFMLAAPIWYISFHAMRYYMNQFIFISSINNINIINITSSLWLTINDGFKRLIKISTNNHHHNNNKNNNVHNKSMNHIQVSMVKLLNDSNGKNGKINNGKIRKQKNGNIFSIASGLQLLKSMGMIDNLTNNDLNHFNDNDNNKILFDNEILLNHKLIPYIIYWCILWIICIFYAHVQISTRFICCSCPPLYWFCAEIIYLSNYNDDEYHKNDKNNKNNKNNNKNNNNNNKLLDNFIDTITQKPTPKAIIAYFLLYFTIGTMAFAAFLPFV